ncbi:MAG TPA: isoamylase early set domain-containing protein [Phnomibacter sp.]|nr:isoamylase early set domain-containing protein [Phnomibacter sp.]
MVQKTYYKTKDYAKVKFTLALENAETVEILGLNSDWENGVFMSKKKDGSFSTEVNLPKSTQHEFKYRINAAEWINEPEADGELANNFGGSNSLLKID